MSNDVGRSLREAAEDVENALKALRHDEYDVGEVLDDLKWLTLKLEYATAINYSALAGIRLADARRKVQTLAETFGWHVGRSALCVHSDTDRLRGLLVSIGKNIALAGDVYGLALESYDDD